MRPKLFFRLWLSLLSIGLVPSCKPKSSNSYSVQTTDAKFLVVTALNGLNLRGAPNTDSKILVTIPYGSILPVAMLNPETQRIQGRNGFWVKTKYLRKEGWLFSGFVFFGKDEEMLRAYIKSLEEPNSAPPPTKIEPLKADTEINIEFLKREEKSQMLGPVKFTQFRYENKPDQYECLATMSGVRIAQQGIPDIEWQARELIGLQPEFENLVVIYSDTGGCSCKKVKYLSLVFLEQSQPKSIEISMPLRQEAACGDIGGSEITTRYNSTLDSLIQLVRSPLCPPYTGEISSKFTAWDYVRYTVIEGLRSNAPQVYTFKTLPEDKKKAWEGGKELKTVPEHIY